jgi:hypothetical protein
MIMATALIQWTIRMMIGCIFPARRRSEFSPFRGRARRGHSDRHGGPVKMILAAALVQRTIRIMTGRIFLANVLAKVLAERPVIETIRVVAFMMIAAAVQAQWTSRMVSWCMFMAEASV